MTEPIIREATGENNCRILLFACPGCGWPHQVCVAGRPQVWGWNNSLEKPTFTPSVLVTYPDGRTCHSFVREGQIQFLGDCFHDLKNQTVDIPPFTW